MEKSKVKVLLFIYDQLKEGKVIRKYDIIDKFKIDERTFYRYIKDIKKFVEEQYSDELASEEVIDDSEDEEFEDEPIEQENIGVILDRDKEGYILTGEREVNIRGKEVLAISKVLLESRAFVKSEMKDIIYKLLDNCISKDKEKIEYNIGNELFNYVSPQHGKELINSLWKISNAINEQKILDIDYLKLGIDGKIQEEISRRTLYPQGLLFSEYYFYLIAFIEGKSYEYPAIYRVDRIKDLTVTDRKYKIEYSKRFQDGEFRKLIQFMQTGKLERVKFRFTGDSIEAVLDKLPNAKIVKEKSSEYIVDAKMFGKGIKMWLLSQGDSIEVLDPDKFRKEMIDTIEKMRMLYS